MEIVGESHHQDNLWRLVGHKASRARVRIHAWAAFVPESDNEYDPNAVSVWVEGLKVGYLSREHASKYRSRLLALETEHNRRPIALPAVIIGPGTSDDGPGSLGVFLSRELDDVHGDFERGSGRASQPLGFTVRTALSDALATDEADDTYDLSWMQRLPSDGVGAITKLRELLQDERDPLDRHFMFNQLEAVLYKHRDVFGSALQEYEDACRRHDSEMGAIREAFVAKWGKVPLLETYRQMCISSAKEKEFQKALWWAERGISLYGADAFRAEAVEDLKKRAEAYRRKLQLQGRTARRSFRGPKEPAD
ncbi:MAG: HIRAN domain-containing protein [Chloroflexi bacterium]|nr:HIRAN domain-containing protein [Chloroflexota bacterium]